MKGIPLQMLGEPMPSISSFQKFDSTICFANRLEAGEKLAQAVLDEASDHPVSPTIPTIVYALPRGGVIVAAPIARQLGCPLDVIVAKKITRPENPELAIGAVTADGHVLWLASSKANQISNADQSALQQAQNRAQFQWQQLAACRFQTDPQGAVALLVDDGVATGMTMAVAVEALRAQNPAEIWICVPVAPPELLPELRTWGDRLIVLATPSPFQSVSRFYQQFPQVEMEEAIECLQAVNGRA